MSENGELGEEEKHSGQRSAKDLTHCPTNGVCWAMGLQITDTNRSPFRDKKKQAKLEVDEINGNIGIAMRNMWLWFSVSRG